MERRNTKRRSKPLAEFVRDAWHVIHPETPYVHGRHIDLICRHLEAISKGEFLAAGLENRLLINVPPGSLKSLLVCVFWPAWEWGPMAMAYLQIIATSYREDFTLRDSRRFRNLVSSEWYQARWPVKLINIGEHRVENGNGGWREAIPFGSLTGGRADRLLIDDPHSVDTAESDADRERTTMRFRESASLRLNNPKTSAIVLIMQRLHQKDITGVILALKMPYIHIMLPMRFEADRKCKTPFGEDWRAEDGDLLSPERSPEEVVRRDELAMGSHATAAQNQQRPAPRGGLLFKRHWFKIVKTAPEHCRWVRGWDLAASETKTSAFTAGVKLGYDAKARHYYIGHVVRVRVSNPEPVIVNTATQDGKAVEVDLPQDPGAAGKIQARALVGALAGFNAHSSPESAEKVARAMPVVAQAEAGNFSVVEGPWNSELLDEIETFPTGYKDQIDALSRAFARMLTIGRVGIIAPVVMSTQISHFGDYPANA